MGLHRLGDVHDRRLGNAARRLPSSAAFIIVPAPERTLSVSLSRVVLLSSPYDLLPRASPITAAPSAPLRLCRGTLSSCTRSSTHCCSHLCQRAHAKPAALTAATPSARPVTRARIGPSGRRTRGAPTTCGAGRGWGRCAMERAAVLWWWLMRLRAREARPTRRAGLIAHAQLERWPAARSGQESCPRRTLLLSLSPRRRRIRLAPHPPSHPPAMVKAKRGGLKRALHQPVPACAYR
jgi:hypothetical protein